MDALFQRLKKVHFLCCTCNGRIPFFEQALQTDAIYREKTTTFRIQIYDALKKDLSNVKPIGRIKLTTNMLTSVIGISDHSCINAPFKII